MGSGENSEAEVPVLGRLVDVGVLIKIMIVRGEIELWGRWHIHFWIF